MVVTSDYRNLLIDKSNWINQIKEHKFKYDDREQVNDDFHEYGLVIIY